MAAILARTHFFDPGKDLPGEDQTQRVSDLYDTFSIEVPGSWSVTDSSGNGKSDVMLSGPKGKLSLSIVRVRLSKNDQEHATEEALNAVVGQAVKHLRSQGVEFLGEPSRSRNVSMKMRQASSTISAQSQVPNPL